MKPTICPHCHFPVFSGGPAFEDRVPATPDQLDRHIKEVCPIARAQREADEVR